MIILLVIGPVLAIPFSYFSEFKKKKPKFVQIASEQAEEKVRNRFKSFLHLSDKVGLSSNGVISFMMTTPNHFYLFLALKITRKNQQKGLKMTGSDVGVFGPTIYYTIVDNDTTSPVTIGKMHYKYIVIQGESWLPNLDNLELKEVAPNHEQKEF